MPQHEQQLSSDGKGGIELALCSDEPDYSPPQKVTSVHSYFSLLFAIELPLMSLISML